MIQHYRVLERERQSGVVLLIDAELRKYYSMLSEGLYLDLDGALDLLRNELSALLQNHGQLELTLRKERTRNGPVPPAMPSATWANGQPGTTFQLPLFFGDLRVGQLLGEVAWNTRSSRLIGEVLGLTGLLVLVWLLLFFLLKKIVISPLVQEFIRLQRMETISQTVQMLAHDVRRPLGLTKAILKLLRTVKTAAQLSDLVDRSLPAVDEASRFVDGMIADVMEMGTGSPPKNEPSPVSELLGRALQEVLGGQSPNEYRFSFSLQNTMCPSVDRDKVHRALCNLIANAKEAMAASGDLWFVSKDSKVRGQSFVELSVANSGSTILAEDIPRLFDPFFSKGKKGGTGLGLAIVHKVISNHGGRVWCVSENNRVEFRFTLPASNLGEPKTIAILPKSSREFARKVARLALVADQETIARGPVDCVLIDDDELVRLTWDMAAVEYGKTIQIFSNVEDFVHQSKDIGHNTDIYIDYFLGGGVRGDVCAETIYRLGFRNIFVATGAPEFVERKPWFKGVVGKTPPFAATFPI